jgi:hypothetical protein
MRQNNVAHPKENGEKAQGQFCQAQSQIILELLGSVSAYPTFPYKEWVIEDVSG